MRLDKYLADCGIASRSEIKKLIRGGGVKVSGFEKIKPETQIEPEKAEVWVNGVKVTYQKYIYLMLNKPQGYLSATRDGRQMTVLDLVPDELLHFEPFPVGRLDIDTEGLCLLTNDGQLAHRLLSPTKHIPKTYFVRLAEPVGDEEIKRFKEGITLDDGYHTMPAELKILNDGKEPECEVTICEGKFHQIKRMFLAVENRVVYLKRIRMNKLELDPSLGLGEIRELSQEELELLES